MTTARENLFKSAFKVQNSVLEINLRPKLLFPGGSDSSCLERERFKTMTVAPETVSMVESLIKKDPK